MTSDLDIYRAAKLLLDQHGDKAPIHAAMTAALADCLTRSSGLGQGLLRTYSAYLDDSNKRDQSPLSVNMRMKLPTSEMGQHQKSGVPSNLVRYVGCSGH